MRVFDKQDDLVSMVDGMVKMDDMVVCVMSRYSDLLPLPERLQIANDQLLRQYLTQLNTYRLNFLLDCSLYDLLLHVMRHTDEVIP